MNRNLFSLAGVLVAVFSFTVGSSDVEARHCRSHRNRCCQQQGHNGYQHHVNHGHHSQGGNGQCCQQTGNNGYQQTTNYSTGPMTYGTPGVAVGVNQPAPPAEPVAPVPAN